MRLFVAVEPPRQVCQSIWNDATVLRSAPSRVTWVEPARMHLTLKFIGERETADGLAQVVQRAVERRRAIPCTIGGVGAFPNFRRPRVVWVGVDDDGALARLAADIDAGCAMLGVTPDGRRFAPHLTLGRVRDEPRPADAEALRAAAAAVRGEHHCSIDRVSLVRSTLGPSGPSYVELASVPLAGGAD